MVVFLNSQRVQFSISVPFERFAELKLMIKSRRRWKRLDGQWDYFESELGPQVLAESLPIPVSGSSGEKAKQGACAVGTFRPS